jgi:hypothetical protein
MHAMLGLTRFWSRLIRLQSGNLLDCWGGLGTKQIYTSNKTLTRVLLSIPISNNNEKQRVFVFWDFMLHYPAEDSAFVFHGRRRIRLSCFTISRGIWLS